MKEFVVHYKKKSDSKEVSQDAMMGNVIGLKQILKGHGYNVDLLKDHVFVDKTDFVMFLTIILQNNDQ